MVGTNIRHMGPQTMINSRRERSNGTLFLSWPDSTQDADHGFSSNQLNYPQLFGGYIEVFLYSLLINQTIHLPSQIFASSFQLHTNCFAS